MANWRKTREYRVWRVRVIRRDKVCQVCGSRKNRQAHHINHASYFPKQRFDVNNGITLCASCHSQFHNNFKNNTREKCTVHDLDNFMDLVHYIEKITIDRATICWPKQARRRNDK